MSKSMLVNTCLLSYIEKCTKGYLIGPDLYSSLLFDFILQIPSVPRKPPRLNNGGKFILNRERKTVLT